MLVVVIVLQLHHLENTDQSVHDLLAIRSVHLLGPKELDLYSGQIAQQLNTQAPYLQILRRVMQKQQYVQNIVILQLLELLVLLEPRRPGRYEQGTPLLHKLIYWIVLLTAKKVVIDQRLNEVE